MEKKIEAFEMWCCQRLLKISWIERISNEEVQRRLGSDREDKSKTVDVCRTCYEKRKDRRPKLTGCRAKGRQREKYMDGIIRTVGDGSKAVQILQMTGYRYVAIHGRQRLQGHGTVMR